MCGIYGTTKQYKDSVIEHKLKFLKKRGPNVQKFQRFYDLTLAHTRLSIIDLEERSNQPLEYDNLIITFNGEIYNFLELKNSLQKKGYSFNTFSDTEVVCALYLEKGEKCVDYLNGMFSFVIYDRKNKILFGARDRLGKKPFYYFWDGKDFEFSSSLYSIRYENELEINKEAIEYYLEWGYVPEPLSMFTKTFKLCAGHAFVLSLPNMDFKKWKYWDIPNPELYKGTYGEAVNQLNDIISKSVEERLVADVPLGIFLSGGIDSSLVASIAQSQSKQSLKTFCVGFKESKYDESVFAGKIADFLKTDHTSIILSCDEGLSLVKEMSDFYDEPLDDSSSIGQLLLSKVTKEHVTVALSGDGGDEFFLGYPQYHFAQSKRFIYSLPREIRKTAAFFLKYSNSQQSYLIRKGLLLNSVEELHSIYYSQLDRRWLQFNRAVLKDYEEKYLFSEKPLLERLSDFDIKTYLNGDILTKVDRGSMAFSLEVRSPLLDYRVLEFAKSLPVHFKYKNGNKKIILKDILNKYIPSELYDRPKQGFAIPVAEWFRNELKDYLMDVFKKENFSTIPEISYSQFNKILEDHFNKTWNNTSKIYRVLMLVQWLNKVKKL